MLLWGSNMSTGAARSSSCSNRCAKRPTYDASNTKLLGSSRCMEKSTTCEYGVFSLSSKPQLTANPPAPIPAGGVTGNEPVGGGSTIGQGAAGQVPVVAALVVGMLYRPEKRAEASTVCTLPVLVILVVNPNEPLRSKVLVMPSPKWS